MVHIRSVDHNHPGPKSFEQALHTFGVFFVNQARGACFMM